MAAERHVLKELGFRLHVEHPHKLLFNYLHVLRAPELTQTAFNFLNDCLRLALVVCYPPHVLASAAILLAARREGVALPEPWWELFDARSKGACLC